LIPSSHLGLFLFIGARADGLGRLLLLHVAALSTAGAVAAAAVLRRRHQRKMKELLSAPAMAEMPKVVIAEHGHVEHIEKFSHYVGQYPPFFSLLPLRNCLSACRFQFSCSSTPNLDPKFRLSDQ
jgi:hypothetical protein